MKRGKLIKFSFLLSVFFLFALFLSTIVLVFGKMSEKVEGYGVISPEDEKIISSSVSGIISTLYVKEGDMIEKGKEIFKLKDDILYAQKEIAEAEFLKATEEYLEARRELDYFENSKAEIERAKEALIRASINLEKAKRELELKKELHKEGITSLKELTDAELEVEVKESEKKSCLQDLRLLLLKKEMERALAKSKLERAENALKIAKEQLELSRKRVAESVFRAPLTGIILEIKKKEGEFVSEGERIGKMVSLDDLAFEINLPQEKISKLRDGQESKVFLDAFPFRKYKIFEGKIKRISPSAEIIGGKLFFKAKISLKENWIDMGKKQRVYLKPGMSGKAKVIVEKDITLAKLLFNKLIYGGR